jgi:Xaa-Pro aminopeptidase
MSKKSATDNRSRTPHSKEFLDFISSDWAQGDTTTPSEWEVASYAADRRERLAKHFKGKLLIIEAGDQKVRANDTEYRYRPNTAFSHLTGWGSAAVPGSVLVIDARDKKAKHTLFFRPTAGRDSDEFFANPMSARSQIDPNKPSESYLEMIAKAILSSHQNKMQLKDIYDYICKK